MGFQRKPWRWWCIPGLKGHCYNGGSCDSFHKFNYATMSELLADLKAAQRGAMTDKAVSGVHWSFWAIGAVTLIFNLMGVLNFFSQMSTDSLSAMPEPYRAIIESRAVWATGAFAIAVFGGALGCLLLLFKKSAAYYVFIASLLGAIVAAAHFHVMANFYAIEALIGSLSQLVVVAFLIWYSKWVERKGWIG
jgi:hypothetical protein